MTLMLRTVSALRGVTWVAAACLAATLAPPAARGACSTDPCAAAVATVDCDGDGVLEAGECFDCDRDGFTDREECTGLTVGAVFYPRCGTGECLDPRKTDLFVKFEKATNSAYVELGIGDACAFDFLTESRDCPTFAFLPASSGLALRVHVLPASTVLPSVPQPNSVTARQPALLVREVRGAPSACPVSAPLGAINGVTSVGGAAIAQIFTQRIIDHVNCVYAAAGDTTGAFEDKVKMILHTTAHEATHANRLAPEPVERFGGHHYRAGSGCVMDQASTYTAKPGSVTFATPTAYCGPDQAAVVAGETALGKMQCEDPSNSLDQDNFTNACLPATP